MAVPIRKRKSQQLGPVRLVPTDALDRLAAAEADVKERPRDAETWIALSQACQAMVHSERAVAAAREAVELEPQNAGAVRQLGYSLTQVGPGMIEARTWFVKLKRLAPEDPIALHYAYYFALIDGDFAGAVEICHSCERTHPGSAITSARLARAYRLMGDEVSAAEYFRSAAERCADEGNPWPYSRMANLRPVYTALAGASSFAEMLSEQICCDDGLGLADLSHPRYLHDTEASIARLQNKVGGRDLYVFGNGPSLIEITERKTEVASFEFASLTMSSFQVIEEDLLCPIGRRADLVCMTHPSMMKSQACAIRAWFSQVPNSMLVLPLWLREVALAEGEPDFVLNQPDHLFFYDSYGELLPNPEEPLHIPAINTLLCALGVAILARPRRIFLFGFDGKIIGSDSQRSGALYYKERHESYHTKRDRPEVREYTQASLWWDSMLFNEVAAHVLRHTGLLFELPQPPIYNVSIESALTPFPRISFDRFCEIVSA